MPPDCSTFLEDPIFFSAILKRVSTRITIPGKPSRREAAPAPALPLLVPFRLPPSGNLLSVGAIDVFFSRISAGLLGL
jgi:hypothetical protein